MKIEHDKEADAKYVRVSKEKIAKTKKVEDWLLYDVSESGEVIGVEILDASIHEVTLIITSNHVSYIPQINHPYGFIAKGDELFPQKKFLQEKKSVLVHA